MKIFKLSKPNIWRLAFGAVATMVCAAVCVALFMLNVTDTIALEQQLRCGIEAHTHTDGCYNGDVVVCDKIAHTHDGNCYIVLLRDNDINGILSLLSANERHSLEYVISDTMSSALVFNDNLNGGEETLSADAVEQLNHTVTDEDTLPDIVFNTQINSPERVTAVTPQASAPEQSGGVSTYAIGDKPVTSNYNANFFVYLDGSWTCIGTLSYTTAAGSSNNRYDYVISTSDVLALVNGALGTDYTYNSFDIAVSTSQNSGYSKTNLGINSVNTVIAYNQRSSATKSARYIRLIPENGAVNSTDFAFYTVTYQYPDGNETSQVVRSGTAVTLPVGYEWTANNRTYDSGESVTISSKTTFEGVKTGPLTFVSIQYNVGFPTVSGVTVSTKPTLAGLTGSTVTDGFDEGTSAVIRNVSQQSVEGKVNNNSTNLSRVIQFRGWRIDGTDVILQPNTTLVWEELLQYQSGGTIRVTAIWDYAAVQTASFFIRFDSVAVDTNGNITGQDSNKYTKELFSAYVGGIDTSLSVSTLHNRYHIADTTADNSYGADQAIRALYGERTEGAYLSALPADDYIFQCLVEYANTGYLSVDGVAVKAEDLNDREYAIRWYVFKAQDDAWHIDGKLVRKEGLIHVYKTFAGNKELIAEAKTDFYIDATDVTAGTNTVLDLRNYTSYNADTDTYMWEIANVDYGELWEITEHPHQFEAGTVLFSVYSEYTVMDAHGDQSISGTGTSLSVKGMTYALDEGNDEVLRAEFTNIYNKSNSIIIKKQDALTGVSIGGATFRLLQNGTPLKFDYDAANGKYRYNPNGAHTILQGTANGYFELSIENFSYDLGNVIVQEVDAPKGYSPIGNIEIGYVDDQHNVGIISGNSEMIKYVGGILIIGNNTDVMSVTANKHWDCPQNEWQPVTLQLLANGKLVTTVIAGVEAQVVLDANSAWSHTWQNLPVYVNGERIVWSVRETMIGSEAAKADGSFVNWLASYELPIQSTDPQGNPHVTLTVTNTTKRVMLRLTKTDFSKSVQLSGAAFMLEGVDKNGNVLTTEVAKSGVTGENGTLIFDNLKCGVRYRLTEQTAPSGYLELQEYVYFSINEDGSVSVEESYYAEAGNTAYNLTVRNMAAVELPESGGDGLGMFYTLGAVMMLLSSGIYIEHLRKRRCRN